MDLHLLALEKAVNTVYRLDEIVELVSDPEKNSLVAMVLKVCS